MSSGEEPLPTGTTFERPMLKDFEAYSTNHLSGRKTVEAWRQYLQSVYYGHEVRVPDHGFIHGHLEKRVIDDIVLSCHRANAHAISRTAALIKNDKAEKHGLIIPMSGTFEVSQGGRTTKARVGQLYLLNASEPFEVITSDGASSVGLTLPSDVCRSAVRGIDDKLCDATVGDEPLIKTLAFAIQALMTGKSEVDPVWLRDFILTFVHAAVDPRRCAGSESGFANPDAANRILVERLRNTIARNLDDVDFRVEDAAAACRVSVRHLQTVLRSNDTSFIEELIEARLKHAHDLLHASAGRRTLIKQIAGRCGFRSQAYFATSYKKRFGIPPSYILGSKR